MITISKDYIHKTEWVPTENEKGEGVFYYNLISSDPETGEVKQTQRFTNAEEAGSSLPLIDILMCMFIDIVMSSKETISFTKEYLENLHQELLKGTISAHAVSSLNRIYLLLQMRYPQIYKWAKKEEEKLNQLENMIVFSNIEHIDESYRIYFDLPYVPNIIIYGTFDIKRKDFLEKSIWFDRKESTKNMFYTVLIRKILLKESTQKRLQNYIKNHHSVRLQLMMR